MDNLPIPPEQNLEQPVVPPPFKINPMYVLGGLFIMALILTGGIFIGKYLNSSQKIPEKEIIPISTLSPSSTVTSTLDPIANWKTYTNTEYNYSFKYPQNLTVGENGMARSDIQKATAIVLYEDKTDKFESPRFAVTARLDSNTLENIARQHYRKLTTNQLSETEKETASKNLGYVISDNQAVSPITNTSFLEAFLSFQYTIKGSTVDDGASEYGVPQEEHKYIWLEANQKLFLISFTNTNTMNQILSTFKFINQ